MDGSDTEIRFHTDKLIGDTSAVYKHFTPGENGRDSYGNRIFRSTEFAYPSFSKRENEKIKASLLISRDGEAFVKAKKGILGDIDRGLVALEPAVKVWTREKWQKQEININHDPINLGNNRTIEYYATGGQSHAFIFNVEGEKVIVKIQNKGIRPWDSPAQPYINEMLQVQAIATDLKEDLEKLGIRLPTYLFASGQVGCSKFEEGTKPTDEELKQFGPTLTKKVRDYITKQKAMGNALWDSVMVDSLVSEFYWQNNNFIRSKDGTLVWIDPFKFDSGWLLDEVVKVRANEGDPVAIRIQKEINSELELEKV